MAPMLHASGLAGWPRPGVVALGSGLAAIPGAGLIAFIHPYFQGGTLTTSTLPILWMMVALLGGLIASVQFWEEVLVAPRRGGPGATKQGPILPAALRGELISITMQDHYLEVTMRAGTTLQSMRFSDALAALAEIPGQRIHRSHWISAEGLEAIVRDRGKPFALLIDGRRLPISRPYLASARTMLAAVAQGDEQHGGATHGQVP